MQRDVPLRQRSRRRRDDRRPRRPRRSLHRHAMRGVRQGRSRRVRSTRRGGDEGAGVQPLRHRRARHRHDAGAQPPAHEGSRAGRAGELLPQRPRRIRHARQDCRDRGNRKDRSMHGEDPPRHGVRGARLRRVPVEGGDRHGGQVRGHRRGAVTALSDRLPPLPAHRRHAPPHERRRLRAHAAGEHAGQHEPRRLGRHGRARARAGRAEDRVRRHGRVRARGGPVLRG
mmetsp:Transcript_11132/g.44840  ORF Transcript_11132/g.44840 Transcript_11132/m.44840 type:complete len:228 (-) Transcript_11132:318-1001(-)